MKDLWKLIKKEFTTQSEEDYQAEVAARRVKSEDELLRVVIFMESQYCAIRKENCTSKCIHFRSGGVWDDSVRPLNSETPGTIRTDPHCKLWRS